MQILNSGKKAAGRGRRLGLAGVLVCGGPLLAPAQLAQELRLTSPAALMYEPVSAVVTLRNNSGRTMRFGPQAGEARIRFEIVLGQGTLINPAGAAPLLDDLELAPGATRAWECNLARCYRMHEHGRYKVQSVVEWGGASYCSAPAYLEVMKGFELSRLRAGVPDDPLASRTYVLEYLSRRPAEENLYLRIEDETAREIYGVFNLGRVVRVRAPELQVDESGNVHVLFQAPGMGYVHAAYTPYGSSLASQNFPGGNRRVEMLRLPDGCVTVTSTVGKPAPQAGAGEPPGLPAPEGGPVTEIKKKVGGLFGQSRD